MNVNSIVKFMAGLLPVVPITADLMEEAPGAEAEAAPQYEDYSGPTMEEEIAAYNDSVPTIHGVESINVQVGDTFDPMAGVYALDNQDGNITGNIQVTQDNVDTSTAGEYTVSYRVENSRNGWFEYTRQITVSQAPSDPIPLVPPTAAQLGGGGPESSWETSTVQFNNMEDAVISTGDDFDPREDIRIIDTDGRDIAHTAYISGEVDTDEPGEYTIAYAVFDQFENPHAHARTITVQ